MTIISDEGTPSEDVAPGAGGPVDILSFLQHIRRQAQYRGPDGESIPVAKGTFAIYPMDDGGVMIVARAEGGVMEGMHHHRISPRMIRALAAFAAPTGNKLRAIRDVLGGKG